MFKVEEKLSKGWAGENAYHVGGYRYLLVDGDRNVSRASPPGKVTTLTKVSISPSLAKDQHFGPPMCELGQVDLNTNLTLHCLGPPISVVSVFW